MPNICHLSVPKSSADRFPEYVNSNRRVLYNKSRFLDLSSSSSIIVSFHCWRVPFCHMENILNKPCRKWYLRRSPRTGQKTCKVIRVPEGYAPSTHPLPAPSGYLPLLGFYPLSASKRWKIIIPSESGTQRWYPEVSSRQSSRPQGCPQGSPQGSPQGLKAVLRPQGSPQGGYRPQGSPQGSPHGGYRPQDSPQGSGAREQTARA